MSFAHASKFVQSIFSKVGPSKRLQSWVWCVWWFPNQVLNSRHSLLKKVPYQIQQGFTLRFFSKFVSRANTVFPRIVSAETILFWKLECGKYSREESIRGRKVLICCFFVSIHNLNNGRSYIFVRVHITRFFSFHKSFQLVISAYQTK